HGYRARKFILRHVPAITAACVAALALLIGTTAAVIQAHRADAERAKAMRVSAFLQATLSAPDTRIPGAPNDSTAHTTVSGLLDNATRRAQIDLATDSAVQSVVLHTIGNTYVAVGEYDKGLALLTRTLAIDRQANAATFPDIVTDLVDVGDAELERGDNGAADSLFRKAASICQSSQRLADSALICIRAIHDLGGATWFENRLAESEQLLTRAVALYRKRLGLTSPLTAIALGNLGGVRDSRGDIAGAQSLYHQSLAAYRTSPDSALPERAFTLTNLAASLEEQGKDSDAVPLVREAIAVISRAQSPNHPDAAVAWIQLGALHRELGDIPLARTETARGLSYLAASRPISRRLRARVMTSEGLLLLAERKPAAARATLQAALDTASAEFGAHDPRLADVQDALGLALLGTHEEREAEAMLRASHETLVHAWGASHPRTLRVAAHIARAQGRPPTL
ncbi:MAG: tetratricopeptide repeat protein, partial [Gemmatimonadota bacterium]|nr:tetratricopeptide repeat protein [Gemmatimonadota bacterium]